MSSGRNLLLHLRPCGIEVRFEDTWYVIAAMDAVEWIALLTADPLDMYDVFPLLAGQAAVEHVEDALWEGRVSTDDVQRTGLEVVSAVGDRPWWVSLRILHACAESWDVIHVNSATGVAFAGWLDEVWSKILTHIDPKKRAGVISDFESTPAGWESEVDFDDEERAFLNAMKAVMS